MGVGRAGLVDDFEEKPSTDRLEQLVGASKHASGEDPFEASMGIYMFKREVRMQGALRSVRAQAHGGGAGKAPSACCLSAAGRRSHDVWSNSMALSSIPEAACGASPVGAR